jgi:hypothetical protein
MSTEQLLQRANRAVKIRRVKTKRAYSIAPELKQFVKKIARPAKRSALIADAFKLAAGNSLAENCRIESFKTGVLKIKVRPGSYMFELQKRATDIVAEMKMQYPLSYIREIKTVCLEQ